MNNEARQQASITNDLKPFSRYLTADLKPGRSAQDVIDALERLHTGHDLVIGLGRKLVDHLQIDCPALRPFPAMQAGDIPMPSTQADLWLWCGADEPGEAVLNAHAVQQQLAGLFRFHEPVDGFKFRVSSEGLGKDLTGYEDGTENPSGQEALDAALAWDGSSFVAVQQWAHDMDSFNAIPEAEQDDLIGRRKSDNVEFEGSPESAHVKRTAQESFDPEAFVLRRSLPWANANGEGLMFVAFGHSLDPFEVQMRRMAGQEDGIIDGLFTFSRPISGGYYWCPPISDGHLELAGG